MNDFIWNVYVEGVSLRPLPKEVQAKLLRVSESSARHLSGADLHPRSRIVQLVLSQPLANRLSRCPAKAMPQINLVGSLRYLFVSWHFFIFGMHV